MARMTGREKSKKTIHLQPRFFMWVLIVCLAIVAAIVWWPNTSPSDPSAQTAASRLDASTLAGVSIVVDAGHGGIDPGAIGTFTQVEEKKLNLEVSLKLKAYLMAAGAQVVMTREEDITLSDEDTPVGNLKKNDMKKRRSIVEDVNPTLMLCVHMNKFTKEKFSGPQVFYQKGGEKGQVLSAYIQQALNDELAPPEVRLQQAGDYFMLRTAHPSVLIECGFLSNKREEALLCTEAYQEKLAIAIANGVAAYLQEQKRD